MTDTPKSYTWQDLLPYRESKLYGFRHRITKIPLISPKYEYAWAFREGLAGIRQQDLCGFIDEDENIIIPTMYDYVGAFAEGVVYARLNEKVGFIDRENRTVIPFIFDDAYSFINGLANVRIAGKDFFINKAGEYVKAYKRNMGGVITSDFLEAHGIKKATG